MEWKNTPDLFNDYVLFEEVSWAMAAILRKYGWLFDDEFFYWIPNFNRGDVRFVKRRPLYWFPQKSTPAEKFKKAAVTK